MIQSENSYCVSLICVRKRSEALVLNGEEVQNTWCWVGCLATVQHQRFWKRAEGSHRDARCLGPGLEIWLFWASACLGSVRVERAGGAGARGKEREQRQGRCTVEHEMLQDVAADTKSPP